MDRTSGEWATFFDVIVLDPDGWDRTNFDESWNELISEEVFKARLQRSTSMRVPKKPE